MEPVQHEASGWAGGLKIFAGLILAVPLIALAAVLFILTTVPDLDVIRREAEAQIHENLGLNVQFKDRFSVTFYPSFGISTGRVSLGVPGNWQTPLVTVDELVMSMDLAPLLADRVVIDKAIAIGLKINLHQPKTGPANWDVLLETLQERVGRTAAEEKDEGNDAFGSNITLEVERLVFRDAGVNLRDDANARHIKISGLSVEADDMRINAPIFFTAGFDYSINQPEIQGKVSAAGQFQLDIARARYTLSGMALRLVASGPAIPPAFGRPEFTGLVSYDRLSQIANLRQFSLTSKIAKVTGDLLIKDPSGRAEAHGDVNFTMADILAVFAADGPRRRYPVTAAGSFDISEESFQADRLQLTLDGQSIEGRLEAQFGDRRMARFELDGGKFDLRQLLADIKTLPGIAKPAGEAEDRPFAVPAGLPPADHIAHVIAALSDALQPVRNVFAALGQYQEWGSIEGKFRLAELVLPEARLGGVKASIHTGDGVVTGGMEIGELAGGSGRFDLKVTLQGHGEGVALNLASRLDDVDSSRLLLGLPDHFGKVTVQGDFQARGATAEAMLQSASGFVDVSMRRPGGLISLPLVPTLPPFKPTRADFKLRVALGDEPGSRRHHVTALARLQDGPTQRSIAVKLQTPIEFRSINDGGPALGTVNFNGALLNGMKHGAPRILGLMSKLRLDLKGEKIHLDELRLLLDGQSARFAGTIGTIFAETPTIKGHVELSELDIPALVQFADYALPDIAPLVRLPIISGEADLEIGPKVISVKFKKLNLDENHFSGSIRFMPGDPADLRYELAGDVIDLDHYLPPPEPIVAVAEETGDDAQPAAAGKIAGSAAKLENHDLFKDLEIVPLNAIKVKGKVTLGSIKWQDYLLRNVLIRSDYKDRALTINPFRIGLFGGTVSGRMDANFGLPTPVLNADLTVKDWRLEQILAAIGRDPREVTGALDIRFRGKFRGRTIKRFKQTLNGRAAFKMKDIVVSRNIGDDAGAGKEAETDDIEITEGTGRFEIHNGEFLNNDLRITAPKISAWGRGRFHIVEDTIDYTLQATYSGALSVPVRVVGKLSDPDFDANIAKVLGGGTGGLLDLPFRILDPIIKPLLR